MRKRWIWLKYLTVVLILLIMPYSISTISYESIAINGIFYSSRSSQSYPFLLKLMNIILVTLPSTYYQYRINEDDGKELSMQLASYVFILSLVVMWIIAPTQIYGWYDSGHIESPTRFLTNYGSLLLLLTVIFPAIRRYDEDPIWRLTSSNKWSVLLFIGLVFAPLSVLIYTTGVSPQNFAITFFFQSLGYQTGFQVYLGTETGMTQNQGINAAVLFGMFPIATMAIFQLVPLAFFVFTLQDYKKDKASKRRMALSTLLASSIFIFQAFVVILQFIISSGPAITYVAFPTPIILVIGYLYNKRASFETEDVNEEMGELQERVVVKVPIPYLLASKVRELLSRGE